MKQQPSEVFLGAILRGFDKEKHSGKPVTCSGTWDQVTMECFRTYKGFLRMFEWDTRKGKQNRIGTIAECIKGGLVPSLELHIDDKGHEVVRRSE
jgi:hypothetical protein